MVLPCHFALVLMLGPLVWAALMADAVMLAGSLFKHIDARISPRTEAVLSAVLATPGLHRLHHSADPAETDTNFGNTLIIWDRLFGTLRRPDAGSAAAQPARSACLCPGTADGSQLLANC
jgi:sterol desaturase/sphingolipid hydroxylase (fatty acid hydroxylase superfamily)